MIGADIPLFVPELTWDRFGIPIQHIPQTPGKSFGDISGRRPELELLMFDEGIPLASNSCSNAVRRRGGKHSGLWVNEDSLSKGSGFSSTTGTVSASRNAEAARYPEYVPTPGSEGSRKIVLSPVQDLMQARLQPALRHRMATPILPVVSWSSLSAKRLSRHRLWGMACPHLALVHPKSHVQNTKQGVSDLPGRLRRR